MVAAPIVNPALAGYALYALEHVNDASHRRSILRFVHTTREEARREAAEMVAVGGTNPGYRVIARQVSPAAHSAYAARMRAERRWTDLRSAYMALPAHATIAERALAYGAFDAAHGVLLSAYDAEHLALYRDAYPGD